MAMALISTGQASCPRTSGARNGGNVFHFQQHAVAPRTASHSAAGFSGREEPRHFPLSRAYGPKVASLETQEKMNPFATKEEYKDSWFDKFMVDYFAKQMSRQLGGRPYRPGYEGFVDLSKEIMKGRSSEQQRQTVSGVLGSLMPPEASARFRQWFPVSKWSAETNASITAIFFKWLVGPLETKEVDVDFEGEKRTWRSGVQIKKCRYLEQSGCVGMCINMCKMPTEDFFTNQFGLPLTMNPNFEDLSCEMIFGQKAPPLEQDEVYNQPCFAHECKLGDREPTPCPKIDTERRIEADGRTGQRLHAAG